MFSSQLIFSLISGGFISGVAGYLGTLMLSKKMSAVADPLAHLAFPGVALALIFGFNLTLGVFPFVVLGVIFIWFLEEKTKLPLENLAAIIFAAGVGTTLLFLPIDKAEEAMMGIIEKISFNETIIIVVLSLLVFFLIKRFYQKMMLINVFEDLAAIEGVNIKLNNFLYLLSVAMVIALGVYLVGGLITAGLIAIPSAAAKNFSQDLKTYKILAVFFGTISATLGILLAPLVFMPTGPLVIVFNVVLFLISVIFRQRSF